MGAPRPRSGPVAPGASPIGSPYFTTASPAPIRATRILWQKGTGSAASTATTCSPPRADEFSRRDGAERGSAVATLSCGASRIASGRGAPLTGQARSG